MRRRSLLLVILTLFLLTACNNQEEAATKEVDKQEIEETKEPKQNYESIELDVSREALRNLPGGTMMEHLPYEEDVQEFNGFHLPELSPEVESKLPDKLQELTESADDIDTIKKGLLSLLASPHYEKVIDQSENYKPQFQEPYLPDPTKSESQEKKEAPSKAIILLDASSSMLLQADGKMKMQIAKNAVKSFAQSIGQTSEVSLVVYGHKGSEADSDKEKSCSGIEEIYPMGEYKKESFQEAVNSFESKGWTPLAGAIQKATDMSEGYEGGTTVYIVSDGAETCGGDPVQASKTLAASNTNNAVNIIGFDVDAEAENQLKEVAEAGNGNYYKADNPQELENTIQYEWLPSFMDLAWAHTMAPDGWEIGDEYDNAEEFPHKLWYIGWRETLRIDEAIEVMSDNEWISEEQASQLEEWSDKRQKAIKELYYTLAEENRDKTDAKAAAIRDKIDKWVEKMRKLKEERGQTWFNE
ncbi:VWA domain-containing protein [Bacillus tianshenii]|nr:VWA domain-containing protein [Bacillus tianshenii]